jgi:serine/threonine protein kinase
MELDLTEYPVGGYGVVIYDGYKTNNNVILNIASVLSKLKENVKNIECFTIDGDKISCSFDEFLDIFNVLSICLKMFHLSKVENPKTKAVSFPYEQEKQVIKSLHSHLDDSEMLQYTPVAYANVKDTYVSFIEINLNTPIVLRTGKNRQMSEPHSKLCCIVNSKFQDEIIDISHIKPMGETLWFLNTKGIFHRDVKFENIMMLNNVPRLVDFGSVRIDDGQQDIMTFYNPTRYVHPFINYYFNKDIPSRSLEHTIGRDLIPKFQCEMMDFVDANRKEKYFTQYMLHKKDCFDFAMLCITKFKNEIYNHNGGSFFASCFKSKYSYEDIRAILDGKYNTLSSFIYMDNQDFAKFRTEYQQQQLQHLEKLKKQQNLQQQGGIKKKSVKQYIQLRSNNKQYLVRVNKNGQKYILVSKNKVLLLNIKNTYRYITK